jgi:hypothetical protein
MLCESCKLCSGGDKARSLSWIDAENFTDLALREEAAETQEREDALGALSAPPTNLAICASRCSGATPSLQGLLPVAATKHMVLVLEARKQRAYLKFINRTKEAAIVDPEVHRAEVVPELLLKMQTL